MPKKDYVERNIEMVGRTKPNEEGDKACGHCTEADDFFETAKKHDSRITYHKTEIDTDEGQEIAEDRDIRGLPYIKDCRTFEKGGKPRCREIEGFEREDWTDLDDLIQEGEADQAQAAKEAEQSAPKEETATATTETEVKEPVEPEEPK